MLKREYFLSKHGWEAPLTGPGLYSVLCQAEPTHTSAEPLGKASTETAQSLRLVLYRTGGWWHRRELQTEGQLKPWRRLPTAKASQGHEELFYCLLRQDSKCDWTQT